MVWLGQIDSLWLLTEFESYQLGCINHVAGIEGNCWQSIEQVEVAGRRRCEMRTEVRYEYGRTLEPDLPNYTIAFSL